MSFLWVKGLHAQRRRRRVAAEAEPASLQPEPRAAEKLNVEDFEGTMWNAAKNRPEISRMVAALVSADLADFVKGAERATLVAPSDAAVSREFLTCERTLRYHVVPSHIVTRDELVFGYERTLPTMLAGATLALQGEALRDAAGAALLDAAGGRARVDTLVRCTNGNIAIVNIHLSPPPPSSTAGAGDD